MNMNKLSDNIKIVLFSSFLFLILSYISNFNFFRVSDTLFQPISFKGFFKVCVYLSIYIYIYINFILFILMRSSITFSFLSILFYFLFVVDITYYLVGEQGGFSIHQILIAINEVDHIIGALNTYGINILIALFIVSLIVYIIILFRKYVAKRFYYLPLFLLPFSYIGSYVVYDKSAYSAYEYMSHVKIPVYIAIANNKGLLDIPFSKRDVLSEMPINESKFKNIVLIVDESVRADYLSINGFNIKTTPFLDDFKDVESLGIASSAANNSAPSQYILRNGLQIKDLPDINFKTLKKPNIFQYAKNAKFNTYYLDSQVEYMQLQNFMSSYDLEHIDEYYTVSKRKPLYNLDRHVLEKLVLLLNNAERNNFIYIVKNGSHVPWLMNYPEINEIFKPTLNNMEKVDFSNRQRAINTYSNSLRWSVDDFFKELFEKISLDETLIIYTSDHGINIAENNTNMFYGMEENPPITTAQVPILLFSKDIKEKFIFKRDIYSHFDIFPSLLDIFGYDISIYQEYGYSFFNANYSQKERYFFSGNIFAKGNINEYKGF